MSHCAGLVGKYPQELKGVAAQIKYSTIPTNKEVSDQTISFCHGPVSLYVFQNRPNPIVRNTISGTQSIPLTELANGPRLNMKEAHTPAANIAMTAVTRVTTAVRFLMVPFIAPPQIQKCLPRCSAPQHAHRLEKATNSNRRLNQILRIYFSHWPRAFVSRYPPVHDNFDTKPPR
jgi:hypothetical protein